VTDEVDLAVLVEKSEGFSPADVEYAAHRASQHALEKALYSADDGPDINGPSTADYALAISETRRTVSDEVAAEFLEDIARLARL
jgi:SpoVK/Ycf46/Vps4 family AAA+-type ATPase